jgi:hypothetical protein
MKTLVTEPFNYLQDISCKTRNESAVVTIDYTSTGETLPSGSSSASIWTAATTISDGDGVVLFSKPATTLTTYNTPASSFLLLSVGTYTVITIYNDPINNITITETYSFDVCDFINLVETSCNFYTYTNLSTTATVQVHCEDTSNVIPASTPVVVPPMGSYTIELPLAKPSGERYVGMFKIITTYTLSGTPVTEIKLVSNFCIIEDCISTYILDIICNDIDRCNPCPDEVDLDRMLLLSYSYFMMLNKEFSLNVFYTVLSNTKLAQIQNLNSIMSKLLKFCERKTCLSESVMNSSEWGVFTLTLNCEGATPISSYTSTCSTCG